jgi:ABC-type polar amino acid transport system ATPase subunit
MITARNLSKKRGDKPVLVDVDLTLTPGRVTAIIGPSGGGKTTLLRALALLDPADAGTLQIDGAAYKFPLDPEAPFVAPWPRLTAVFQQLFLWPHLTLRENILLPLRCLKRADADQIVDPLVDRFDMAGFVDRYPNQVSGGQQQRAALARALALKPDYLLLDEITSALDVEQSAILLSHLSELRGTGIGILLISHHLHFLQRASDEVVFLDAGRIIETGGPDMLTAPKTQRVARFVEAAEIN